MNILPLLPIEHFSSKFTNDQRAIIQAFVHIFEGNKRSRNLSEVPKNVVGIIKNYNSYENALKFSTLFRRSNIDNNVDVRYVLLNLDLDRYKTPNYKTIIDFYTDKIKIRKMIATDQSVLEPECYEKIRHDLHVRSQQHFKRKYMEKKCRKCGEQKVWSEVKYQSGDENCTTFQICDSCGHKHAFR